MKRSTTWFAVLPSLVIPVCIGMMLYLGMLALINHQIISDATVLRYLLGHPVSKITVAMFFVGFASLSMIGLNIFEQFSAEKKTRIKFEAEYQADEAIDQHAIACGQAMLRLPRWMHEHYLWNRIGNALQSIYRTGSTNQVDDELKHLADLDLDRQQQRYSLVQILIWATPMLGFLGTVLGISQALGGITVGPDNDFQTMMDGLRGSLYVAFDTTALALTLSMILMFGQFFIERFELQLLEIVDQRARTEISNQFDLSAPANTAPRPTGSPQPSQQSTDEIMGAVKLAAESQTEIWRKSIHAAEQAWTSSLSDVSGQVQNKLSIALDESVSNLAHYLGEAIQKADTSMSHRWEQWQVLLSDNARLMSTHQTRLAEQTELIQKLLTQTEETALFEPAISKNQDAIEQTLRLRETLADLSKVVSGLAHPPAVNDSRRSDSRRSDSRRSDSRRSLRERSENSGEGDAAESTSKDRNPTGSSQFADKTVDNQQTVLPFPSQPVATSKQTQPVNQPNNQAVDKTINQPTKKTFDPNLAEVILPLVKKAA